MNDDPSLRNQGVVRMLIEQLVEAPVRGSPAVFICGAIIMALAFLALVGWFFEFPPLIQTVASFQPMRPLSALAYGIAGAATVASASGSHGTTRLMARTELLLALAGAVITLSGVRFPIDGFFEQRALAMHLTWHNGISIPAALAITAHAVALLRIVPGPPSRGTSVASYVLGILLIAFASTLAILHVSDLQYSTESSSNFGAALQPLISCALLGTALIVLVSRSRPVPLSPPRWVPLFTGVTIVALVSMLSMVLRAQDKRDAEYRERIAAAAFARSVEIRLENVERALLRVGSATQQFPPASGIVNEIITMLMLDVPGLDQVLFLGPGGRVIAALPDSGAVPRDIQRQLSMRFSEIVARHNDSSFLQLNVEALPSSRWTAAVIAPVAESDGVVVLAGVLDEAAFLSPIIADSSNGYRVELVASPGNDQGKQGEHEYSRQLGTRSLRYRMVPTPGSMSNSSTLPDVVLVLGLGVAFLVTLVLQQLRDSWRQARMMESARLQSALDNATDGIWEYDFVARRGRRSQTQLRHLGYDPESVNRDPEGWLRLIHADDVPRVMALVEHNRTLADAASELVYRVRAADGSYHTIVDRGRVVERTTDSMPWLMYGISADVTERQRVEEAQIAGERRFRTMFDAAQQFQVLLDVDGVCLEINEAARSVANVSREQVVGQSFFEGPWWKESPDAGTLLPERFAEALQTETARFEIEARPPQGRSTLLDFSFTPLLDANGEVMQVLAEGRDITERRRAEEALREIGALTTMGRLASRVAHEINNPLAGIQNSFLLLADAIPETHPHFKFIGAIEREIQRIAVVTRQLFETYRPDQDTSTSSSVVLAVNDAVTFLDQVNRGRGVRITTDVSRAPSSVPVPDALLRQTLYNLVQNAVEASPPNGLVTVTAALDADECVIVVGDQGADIPPDMRSRIWDPFYTNKDSYIRTSGMGIGLALVRQSVEAVGGTIQLIDTLVGGATFEVRLPMTPVTRAAMRRKEAPARV